MTGHVLEILVAETIASPIRKQTSVKLEAGKGIVGDRYFNRPSPDNSGEADFELTLIEQEQIEHFNNVTGFNYNAAHFRRNIVTENSDLNSLVGKEFTIGDIKCKGISLCEPCRYLSEKIGHEFLQHMVHRGGLRAQILSSGEVSIGDTIKLID